MRPARPRRQTVYAGRTCAFGPADPQDDGQEQAAAIAWIDELQVGLDR